jgi:hypothetical protein
MRLRVKDLRERVRQCVDGERLSTHRRGFDQRQAVDASGEPRRVGGDDAIAFDAETHERELVTARRVSDDLDHAASVAPF